MSFEYFERFFAFTAVGLSLLVVGGVNLAFGRCGGRKRSRAVASLAVCGTAVAALATVAQPEMVLSTGGVLLGILAVAALLGSDWFARRVAALLAAIHNPAGRWALVTLGGLGVVLAGALAFERTDEEVADQQTRDLQVVLGKPNTQPSTRGRAATDRGTPVVLKEPTEARGTDTLTESEDKLLRDSPYFHQMIRRGAPTDSSNCHGWVFTGGKFFLSPDDVEAILKENGYHEVHEPHPGDLVIYRQGGTVSHTAIVRYVAEGQAVLVEGKWGTLGVYLHPADKSYYGTEYTFHRSARSGHLLVGLGGTAGSGEPTATAE